jgi:glycosyltransferase involved in cell wall biosynthesis
MATTDYVLLTPARNEASTIGPTIEAVAAQTVRPRRWVIVSDGSTDDTDAIVQRYAAQHGFITFHRKEGGEQRDFGAKVYAIRAAFERIGDAPYDFIGNLDADVTFAPEYFECLLMKFHENPKLGIAGGVTFDVHEDGLRARYASLDSVGGAVQLFRRACWDSVGGYRPLRRGMEDSAALYLAQMSGWETRSFPELQVLHHRPTGTAGQSVWRARFRQGMAMRPIGWSPAWVLLRTVARFRERPYILGSVMRTCGFFWATLKREPFGLPPEVIHFIRDQQRRKLHNMVFRRKNGA